MAVTMHEMYPGGVALWNWYNVSHPVGSNAPNRRDDVCLVQLLLAYLRPYVRVLQDPSLWPLAVDGLYGPITQSYIDAYQSHLQVKDSAYRPDGVVDPAIKYQMDQARSKRGKMICILNFELHEKAQAAHDGIPTDIRTPLILQIALKRVI